MKKKGRFLLQLLVVTCILSMIAMLGIGPISQAQRIKSEIEAKLAASLEQTGKAEFPASDEAYVLDGNEIGVVFDTDVKNVPSQFSLEAASVLGDESEPNGTSAQANPLSGNGRIRGNILPNGDVDFFRFTATAGDMVFAATMTSFSSNASTDSQLRLIGTDGLTEIEFDDDDGALGGLSSTISGVNIPSTGTYFLRVNHFSATTQLRPYELYFQLQSGTPTAEVEPNDTPGTANALPPSGWVSGTRNPAAATEQDWYSMALNAGDTVFFSLNLDPERDNVQWNGRLGVALFGDASNQVLVVDDASTGSAANPLSEVFFMTVKTAGTYFAFVDSANAATGGPTATYNLSVSVVPAASKGVNCTTYTSTDVPKVIPAAGGLVSSTLTVPGSPRIADLDLILTLDHLKMADVDLHLRSPNSNDNGIFTDIGATANGGQTMMDIFFSDEAGIPPTFTVVKGVALKPELNYRMDWFDGENAGGVWTLDIRDDVNDANGGNLTAWSLRICEQPAAPAGTQTIYSEDFEASAGGYTSNGTANEWERGLPATAATTTTNPVAAFQTCNSGTNCWKTDLDNTYDISNTQNLESSAILIPAGSTNVQLSWAMRYQMENATFDHAWVEVFESGNPTNIRRVWEWTGATMADNTVGTPTENIPASAGWGTYFADISSFAGTSVIVRFHVDSDTSINFGGLAVDDVKITRNAPPAPSMVSGRLTSNGRGVSKVDVTLTEQNGTRHKAVSTTFGYFTFFNILSQQNVTLTARSKTHTFVDTPFFLTGDSFTAWNGTPNP